jgi:hypothetical protein
MIACVGAAMLVFAGPVVAGDAEPASGVAVDKNVSAYKSTKCGGGEDGVEIGKSLCYT